MLAYAISLFFLALVNPFVTLWIGSDFILEKNCILIIAVNTIFFYQLRIPSQIVINTYGLFWQIKWKSIIEAIVNLICSLLLTAWLGLGILGILLAALISNVFTSLWWEPYVAFKKGMKIPIKLFITEFVKNCVIFVLSVILLFGAVKTITVGSALFQMTVNTIICAFIIMIMVAIFYYKTSEFKYFLRFLNVKK